MHLTRFHITLSILLASVCLAHIASATPPKKPNIGQFNGLITRSPFTIKPTPETLKADSPLERDWMLASIRPSGNGYSVTLMHKKNRKERIRFLPGFSSGEYQLIDVKQDNQSNKNSQVLVRKGSQEAWISYDEKLIKVRRAAAGKARGKKVPAKKVSSSVRRTAPKKATPRIRHVPRSGR
jgi:hypothetical protein